MFRIVGHEGQPWRVLVRVFAVPDEDITTVCRWWSNYQVALNDAVDEGKYLARYCASTMGILTMGLGHRLNLFTGALRQVAKPVLPVNRRG